MGKSCKIPCFRAKIHENSPILASFSPKLAIFTEILLKMSLISSEKLCKKYQFLHKFANIDKMGLYKGISHYKHNFRRNNLAIVWKS